MILPLDVVRAAYRQGWFPMGQAGSRRIEWYSPDPRGILPLDGLHVPERLRRTLRSGRFEIRVDTAFEAVVRHCAAREETWISTVILDTYTALHRAGDAHSVEAWRDGRLVGGLYGVALGGAFFGESMFHLETDASKVALHALVARLHAGGFTLLDVQWATPHLAQFGVVEVPRAEYLRRLARALEVPATFPA